MGTERDAKERHCQARFRGSGELGRSRAAPTFRRIGARALAGWKTDAGSSRCAAKSRDRKMVAYHQGGGNQSRVGENLTRIAVQPSQRLNEILIKKKPPFGGPFVWSI